MRCIAPLLLALGCALPLPWREAPPADPSPLFSGTRQLTFDGRRSGEGYFSSDGRRIVFQSERVPGNPFFQIYVLDLETGDVERVSPGVGKTTCAWLHPKGERVLFASTHLDPEARSKQGAELARREADEKRRYEWDYDPHYDLFAADLGEPGALVRLTAELGYDAEASYSPDGEWVAFASNRHAYTEGLSAEERERFEENPSWGMELYRMRADGSDVERLTHTPGYDGGPFFSPDGERIVWRRFTELGDQAEIFTMAVDGTDVRQLTRLGVMSWAPFYHPTGDYVIFTTNLHGFGNFELYMVDAEGAAEPARVTHSEGFDGLPAFSPDGRTLAWTSRRGVGETSQIFLADWHHERVPFARGAPLPSTAIDAADLRRHVERLASDAMQGRLTGTEGERLATAYVADELRRLGLEPLGPDGSYFQEFEFTAGVSIGTHNQLSLRVPDRGEPQEFEADRDWRPLSFSRTGEAAPAPVVFAGYGIVAPETSEQGAYDAYEGLDVKGAWVAVLRGLPEDVSPERRQHLHRHASLRYKAMLARDRGAVGLIALAGPHSKYRHPLVRLGVDASAAGTSLFGFSAGPEFATALLIPGGVTLGGLQQELDGGDAVPGFELEGVSLQARIDLQQERRVGRNTLARLPAAVQAPDAAPVVIGAHVDHLGVGGGGSSLARDGERGSIHYGADDNASGVAALLEVAELLSARVASGDLALTCDVVFAAWSGEELGLLGSDAYAARLPDVHEAAHAGERQIAVYLNMDMVGRLEDELVIYGVGSSSAWPGEIERRNAPIGLPISAQSESYLPTDATSFYLKGIPVLSPFTGVHDEYHTPRDTPDRLNYAGMEKIARLVASIAESIATSEDLPPYVASVRPENLGARAGLRAYLGTVPSYSQSDVLGLALSGVTKGGPADAAGIRAGDVIVELAGRTVENIYDYTYAIDALKIGEPVPITVLRKGERLPLSITPGSRD